MANKDYVIKVSLDGDASGLNTLATELSDIEKMADGLSSKKISVSADISGSALDTIKDIDSKLSSLDDRTISINVSGSVESSLKNIEGHLDKISKKVDTKVDVKGNAESELKGLQSLRDRLEKPITVKIDANDSAFKNMLGSLNAIESRLGSVNNSLKNLSAPDDIGMGQIVENMNALSSRIGTVQAELNSLSVPDITPKINTPDLSNYYASFDGLGNMSMGSFGGTSILSMMGLNSVKSLTWGNAVADQMNDQLLSKMPQGKNGEKLADKVWEGGADNLAHAVTQNRLVRKTELIPQVYSFTMGTGAEYEDFTTDLFGLDDDFYGTGTGMDVLAAFMEHVSVMDGPVRAQSAVFDLSKAWDGACSSVDQYGISLNNLKEHGFNPKDKNKTMKQYLKAVGEIIQSDKSNVLVDNTMEGGMAKLTKRFHNSGQKLGKMMMQPVDDLMSVFTWLDKQDWNFMGITIPKGTLTQGIIATTGIASSISPLLRTINEVKNSFGKATNALNAFKDSVGSVGNKIRGWFSGDGDLRSWVGQQAVNISDPNDVFRELGRTKSIENGTYRTRITHGLFDYDDHLIDASENLSDWQKEHVKRQKRSTSRLFDLYYGEDYVEKEAERNLKGNKKYKEADWKTKQEMLGETRGKIRKSKLNELNSKSFFQKLKIGAKGSFRGTGTAFRTEGLGGGLRAVSTGLGNLGGTFVSLLGAINPVTIALYGLMAGIAAIGGILLIAYANSEKFRAKLGELNEKIHELFDTLVFTIGDMLQAAGITESGGAEGISEVAIQIVEILSSVVEYIKQILMAMTGRDLVQSKKTETLEGQLKNSINKLKQEESEKGYGNASHKSYQDVVNKANQIKMWDPTYWSDDKMDEYAEKYGLNFRDDVYTDTKGVNFGRDILQADLDDPWFANNKEAVESYNYYKETKAQELEERGIHVSGDELLNSLKTDGKWDEEKKKQLNTAIAEDYQYILSGGRHGTQWNDSAFVKANPNLHSEEKEGDKEKRDGGLPALIIGKMSDILWVLDKILMAITAKTIYDGILSARDKYRNIRDKIPEYREKYGKYRDKAGDWYDDHFNRYDTKNHSDDVIDLEGNKNGKYEYNPKSKPKSDEYIPKDKVEDVIDDVIDAEFETYPKSKSKSKKGKSSKGSGDYEGFFKKDYSNIREKSTKKGKFKKPPEDYSEYFKKNFFGEGNAPRVSEKRWDVIKNDYSKLPGSKNGGMLTKLTSKLGDKGIGGLISKAIGKIGGSAIGKTLVGSIPVIGQIIDALWIAWDLTSIIGDTLHSFGVPEWLLEMIMPLRQIQNHWEDIMGFINGLFTDPVGAIQGALSGLWESIANTPLVQFFSWVLGQLGWMKDLWDTVTSSVSLFGQTVMDTLDSMGLGFVADTIQYIWDKLVGFYEWLKGLPIVGWLMPDGGTAESATQDMTNSTQALSNSSENVDSSNSNMWDAAGNILGFLTGWGTTGSAFNSSAGSTAYQNGAVQPINGQGAPNSLQQQAQQQNVVNNNVHIDGGGITAEELAKLVVKVLNEHVFWDAQKAGRTIDTGGIVGSVGL